MQAFSDVRSVLTKGIRMYVSLDSDSEVMRSVLKAVGVDEIAMAVPFKNGSFFPLQKGTPIDVFFYQGSGRYFFKTVVTGRIIFEGRPILKCAIPSKMIRTERREYFRVETLFPLKLAFKHLKEMEPEGSVVEETGESEMYDALCVDISGGGMQLHPDYSQCIPLRIGMRVGIDFCEALQGLSKADGIVVREPKSFKNGWGIRFSSISEADRNKIIKYVYKKQFEKKQWEYSSNSLNF